jgi:hypothetical protein
LAKCFQRLELCNFFSIGEEYKINILTAIKTLHLFGTVIDVRTILKQKHLNLIKAQCAKVFYLNNAQ